MIKLAKEDEEDQGPSVDSADPEERILARRLRIEQRNRQLKRGQLGEDVVPKNSKEEDLGKGLKQLDESQRRLEKLRNAGFELVTNVKIASNAREMQHYKEESEKKLSRNEKLEAEAKTSVEKFNEISQRWNSADHKTIPQDLHKLLVNQTESCDMVISDKNKIINQLQMDLKKNDDEYVKNLKKQAESVDLLIQRMEEQVKNMKKSYRDELIQIEDSFIEERNEMVKANRAKWDSLTTQRRECEKEFLDLRFKRVDDHENQLNNLRTNDTEEYNMVKVKLETDVQILEQQLQQMKATYQLNQEKLEYNFQVLKKRDEENMMTKAQQKRKITKLQDLANNMKIKYKKQQNAFREENSNLTEEYHRIAQQYKELHKKFKQFSRIDWKRFEEIWLMNEAEARKLVDKVLRADQIIDEQQLGLSWTKPEIQFYENCGPIQSGMDAEEKSASDFINEVLSNETQSEKFDVSLSTTKKILEILCDEGGFLVEEKLRKLLQPLKSGEKSLIKLDAIFKSLQVTTEEDVKKLTKFFIKTLRAIEMGILPSSNLSLDANEESSETSNSADESSESSDKKDNFPGLRIGPDGDAAINKNNVLYVLKLYVEEHIVPSKEKPKSSLISAFTASLTRDISKDEEYWKSMTKVISEKKLIAWDALLDSFKKYQ